MDRCCHHIFDPPSSTVFGSIESMELLERHGFIWGAETNGPHIMEIEATFSSDGDIGEVIQRWHNIFDSIEKKEPTGSLLVGHFSYDFPQQLQLTAIIHRYLELQHGFRFALFESGIRYMRIQYIFADDEYGTHLSNVQQWIYM